ncbi:MAG: SurA N-terminal domain-containing protein, partial [Syntrophales bacterium]|nr:SurA N-terminal domain-containing protein [Syntrophales bacterium]
MNKPGTRIVWAVTVLLLLISVAACGQSADNTKNIKGVEIAEAPKVLPLPETQGTGINMQSPVPLKNGAPLSASTVIAQVDDVKMTKGQLDALEKQKMTEISGKVPAERLSQVRPEVRRQIIDYFIVNNLLNNEIRRLQIQIADREIKEALEALKGSLPSGV